MKNYTKDQIDLIINNISTEISLTNIIDKNLESAQQEFRDNPKELEYAMSLISAKIAVEYTKEFVAKMFYELLCEDD